MTSHVSKSTMTHSTSMCLHYPAKKDSSNKLIAFVNQCWFNVGPPSTMVRKWIMPVMHPFFVTGGELDKKKHEVFHKHNNWSSEPLRCSTWHYSIRLLHRMRAVLVAGDEGEDVCLFRECTKPCNPIVPRLCCRAKPKGSNCSLQK